MFCFVYSKSTVKVVGIPPDSMGPELTKIIISLNLKLRVFLINFISLKYQSNFLERTFLTLDLLTLEW